MACVLASVSVSVMHVCDINTQERRTKTKKTEAKDVFVLCFVCDTAPLQSFNKTIHSDLVRLKTQRDKTMYNASYDDAVCTDVQAIVCKDGY